MIVRWACATVFLAAAAPQAAAEPIQFSGNYRIRADAMGGQVRPGFARSEMVMQHRLVLGAKWQEGPLTLTAELWDSRVWGVEPRSLISAADVNAIEPVQINLKAELSDTIALTAGRMILNLGSRRLVAADDFRNTTSGYTGLRLDLGRSKGPNATLIAVLPQQRLPDDFESVKRNRAVLDHEGFDQQLHGLFLALPGALPGGTALDASFVHAREQDRDGRPTRDRNLWTGGARLLKAPAPGAADLELEGFFQAGSVSAGLAEAAPRLDVEAWFVHAEAGYSPRHAWKPRIALEVDAASGDDRGPTFRRFDTLFGMRRADFAPSNLYAVVGRTNLISLGPRIEFQPSARSEAFITWKQLWAERASDSFSTSGVRDPSGAAGRRAGQQLDGRIRHWILKDRMRAELNTTLLFREGLLIEAPTAPDGRLMAYASLALTTSF